MNLKNWEKQEIPDLIKPFTKEQFKEYATKYGLACAQEFLECCDYIKPQEAWRMFNPTKNAEIWESNEIQQWFEKTFKTRLFDYIDGFSWSLANTYSIDIIKFEKYLHWEFGYNLKGNESIHNFMIKTFGAEDTEKFKLFFFNFEFILSPKFWVNLFGSKMELKITRSLKPIAIKNQKTGIFGPFLVWAQIFFSLSISA
jgi:hypothetical protein